MRVYLSGGMEYAVDEGKNWRAELETWLRDEFAAEVFNPNVESERFLQARYPNARFRDWKLSQPDRFSELVSHLVDLDCREIAEHSDAVICLWDESAAKGAGTKGELTMARYFRKPVYLVTQVPFIEIPGWVIGCTTNFFRSFDDLRAFLNSEWKHS